MDSKFLILCCLLILAMLTVVLGALTIADAVSAGMEQTAQVLTLTGRK